MTKHPATSASKNTLLQLKCPQCKSISAYAGYPADPILSNVQCLTCGYIGVGGSFKHIHPAGESCRKGTLS